MSASNTRESSERSINEIEKDGANVQQTWKFMIWTCLLTLTIYDDHSPPILTYNINFNYSSTDTNTLAFSQEIRI